MRGRLTQSLSWAMIRPRFCAPCARMRREWPVSTGVNKAGVATMIRLWLSQLSPQRPGNLLKGSRSRQHHLDIHKSRIKGRRRELGVARYYKQG